VTLALNRWRRDPSSARRERQASGGVDRIADPHGPNSDDPPAERSMPNSLLA
jgi:hypothetical protein